MPTKIEWTDETWNPIRGCSRVSEGCRNCYAEKTAYRFSGPGGAYEGLVRIGADGNRRPEWNGQVRFVEKHLLDPLSWKKPLRIFVNSMSDLFHENVTDRTLDQIFAVMALCPQHTFQVLTKRPERMLAYCSARTVDDGYGIRRTHADRITMIVGLHFPLGLESKLQPIVWPLPNLWLGVSVENQQAADERIPLLLQTPAAKRFISAEPLLGSVNLRKTEYLTAIAKPGWQGEKHYPFPTLPDKQRTYFIDMLDWVIAGGESGPGARPMHPDWARSLRDQCVAARVPFFFKQWGEWCPYRREHNVYGPEQVQTKAGYKMPCRHIEASPGGLNAYMQRVGKKAAGDLLDGKQWHQFPDVPRDTFCTTRGEL